ncbi:MAG: metallophosphoesterase [Bacteroidetes bacterium]|nr:metallophosphoesterase [Bacteroidota bacterium]
MRYVISFLILVFPFFCCSQSDSIVRGPYLQQTGPSSTYICWKTKTPCDSKVLYGVLQNSLTSVSYTNHSDTNHCNLLSGLLSNTRYYYTVNQTASLMGNDTFYFYTAPPAGSVQKVRFLALGDCGSGFVQQYNVKAAINYYNQNKYINGILLLGDNAYVSGVQNEIPYYDIFKTPQNAEMGGVASHHKEFYSFNYANAHFISLDSYGIEQGTYHLWDSLGPQYQWLEQDLQQDKSMWKIVYFHHPPFTMGSHNSDLENDLVQIRKNIARLLEKYGVDLVINGHSHTYERSWLQKGHYDLESTFNKSLHLIDSSSARYDGSLNSCPYKKDTANSKGTIYVVAGESGKIGTPQASYPHNSKYFSETSKAGALFFEIEENRLDAFYLEEDSLVHDKFTIMKNVNKHSDLSNSTNQAVVISASWNGTYSWSYNHTAVKSQIITPGMSGQFIVTDSLNCLADTFSLIVSDVKSIDKTYQLIIYPNPVKDKLMVELKNADSEWNYSITSVSGQVLQRSKTRFIDGKSEISLSNLNLAEGSYFITLNFSEKSLTKPFFIDR